MTGYRNDVGRLQHEIGVYYVSKSNFGVGQKVGEYTDLSFLAHGNFDAFIEKVRLLSMIQKEIDKIKERREREIGIGLTKLNNDIYQNENELGAGQTHLISQDFQEIFIIPSGFESFPFHAHFGRLLVLEQIQCDSVD